MVELKVGKMDEMKVGRKEKKMVEMMEQGKAWMTVVVKVVRKDRRTVQTKVEK